METVLRDDDKMKLTLWFGNEHAPARSGVYEIRGSRFTAPNFRHWDCHTNRWGYTGAKPEHAEAWRDYCYDHGEDMTGWRGVVKEKK